MFCMVQMSVTVRNTCTTIWYTRAWHCHGSQQQPDAEPRCSQTCPRGCTCSHPKGWPKKLASRTSSNSSTPTGSWRFLRSFLCFLLGKSRVLHWIIVFHQASHSESIKSCSVRVNQSKVAPVRGTLIRVVMGGRQKGSTVVPYKL